MSSFMFWTVGIEPIISTLNCAITTSVKNGFELSKPSSIKFSLMISASNGNTLLSNALVPVAFRKSISAI